MLAAVLFDLDGVIVDTEALMRYAFATSYRLVVGPDEPPVDQYVLHSGEAFDQIMKTMSLPKEMYEPFRTISDENLHMVTVFPGITEVLKLLTVNRIKKGVVTGKNSKRAEDVLERFDLKSEFEVIIGSDLVAKSKPDPEGITLAMTALRSTPGETVMIGDAVNDIVAARNAKVMAIAVTWGLGSSEHLAAAGADAMVDHPAELLEVIELKRAAL